MHTRWPPRAMCLALVLALAACGGAPTSSTRVDPPVGATAQGVDRTTPEARAAMCLTRLEVEPTDPQAVRCARQALERLGRAEEWEDRIRSLPEAARRFAAAEAQLDDAPEKAALAFDTCAAERPACVVGAWLARARMGTYADKAQALPEATLQAVVDAETPEARVRALDALPADRWWAAAATPLGASASVAATRLVHWPDDPGVTLAALADPGEPGAETHLEALESLVEWAPGHLPARRRLAAAHVQDGQAGAALAHADLVLAQAPADDETHLVRALALVQLGRIDEARGLFDALRVLRGAPLEVADGVRWARALGRAGLGLQAEAAFSVLTTEAPRDPAAWAAFGRWLLSRQKAGRAVSVLERALQTVPESAEVRRVLARALDQSDRADAAREAWQALLRLAPGDEEAEDELARLEVESGHPAAGITRWEALVARSPRAVRPRLRLALAYRALERPADAARMLAPVVEMRPKDAELRARYAQALLEAGRPQDALTEAERARRDDPELPLARVLRAAALAGLERWEDALAAHEDASALDPDSVPLHMAAATLAMRLGDQETAARHLAAVVARQPNEPTARGLLAALEGGAERPLFVWPAAAVDPVLAALASRVVAGSDKRSATVLRDERVVEFDRDGVLSILHRRSLLVHDNDNAEAYREVSVPFNAERPPTVLVARTLTPDGEVVEVPEAARRVRDPLAGTPLQTDARELVFRFPRVGSGAIVDYEVRVDRPHPESLGVWWDRYVLGNPEPTVRALYRLEGPSELPAPSFSTRGLPAPERTEAAGRVTWTWSLQDLAPMPLSGGGPDGAPPLNAAVPTVSVASTLSWAEVDAWYAALFLPAAEPDAAVRAHAARLVEGVPGRRQRIAAIFDDVERNVAYLGLELGIGAFKPREAASTLTRRAGDCKDMTALLRAMLASIGIESYAALVRPEPARLFDEAHPTPGQFNHVMLYVPDPEGDLWLDATASLHTLDAVPSVLRERPVLLVDGRGGRRTHVPGARPPRHSVEDTYHFRFTPTAGGRLERRLVLRGDPAGEVRQRLTATPEVAREALLRSPGIVFGARFVPDTVRIEGVYASDAPLVIEAVGSDRDLAGLRPDGTIVNRLSLAMLIAPALGGPFEDRRPPEARRLTRRWTFEAPPGYGFEGPLVQVRHRGRHADLELRESRSGQSAVFTMKLELRDPPRTSEAATSWADELTKLAERVDHVVSMRPGAGLDLLTLHRALHEEQPDDPAIATLLARTLLVRRATEEAVSVLDHAQATPRGRTPEVVALWLGALGDTETAEVRFDEAVARADALGDEPRVQSALGDLAAGLARSDVAERSYRRSLALAPDHPVVLNNFAWLLRDDAQRREEALQLVRRSLVLDPTLDAAWDTLAELLARSGEYERALEANAEAMRLSEARRSLYEARRRAYVDERERRRPKATPAPP